MQGTKHLGRPGTSRWSRAVVGKYTEVVIRFKDNPTGRAVAGAVCRHRHVECKPILLLSVLKVSMAECSAGCIKHTEVFVRFRGNPTGRVAVGVVCKHRYAERKQLSPYRGSV